MSDIRAVLSSDKTIKAVLNSDKTLKAVVSQGVTVNHTVNGGNAIIWNVPVSANNQIFVNDDLTQYASNLTINLLKNGVFVTSDQFYKLTSNSIQINTYLNAGDILNVLATGSATIGVGAGFGVPGGLDTQIQYNWNGNFAGDANFTFDRANGTAHLHKISSTQIVSNEIETDYANIIALDITNTTVSGNLEVDKNLTANSATANNLSVTHNITAGNLSISGSLGFANANVTNTLIANNFSSNTANLGSVDNVKITGGTNGYVLVTDGTGNLSWTAQTGGSGGGGGSGSPAGSDKQIQFNDGGSFGASSGLAFNKSTSTLTATNIAGNLVTPNQSNITSVGTLITLNVAGNVYAENIFGNLVGDGSNISNINANNVSGVVANAVYASVSGTSVSIAGANITGTVANATYSTSAGSATTAGTVTTAAQPNITSTGTLINLTVTNTITGNISGSAGSATTAGTVTTGAQPNITQVGNLTALNVNGNITSTAVIAAHYGSGANLTNIPAANIVGTVANANYATNAGTAVTANSATVATTASLASQVTASNQPNITSTGTLANLYVSGTVTSGYVALTGLNETVISTTGASGTLTPNVNSGTIFKYTLSGNITINSLANAVAGSSITIILVQDSTGNRTLTSSMKFAGGSKTLTTSANSIDIMSVFYDGTNYYASLSKGFA